MTWPPDDRVRRAFAETATRYDDLARRRFRRIAIEMVRAAGVRRGDRMLDVACGSGLVGRVLTERGLPEPVGLDISPALLRLALLSRRIAADATRMPIADETFDVVLCSLGVQMFEDPDRGLAEMCRVLRPHGRLALTTWGEQNSSVPLDEAAYREMNTLLARQADYDPARWEVRQILIATPEELEEALADAGFRDVRVDVRRKRTAFRGVDHYFDMLAIFPGTWARLEALGWDLAGEARARACDAIRSVLGRDGPFEVYEEVLIAAARR